MSFRAGLQSFHQLSERCDSYSCQDDYLHAGLQR
jgi:hypothetical protein